MEIVDEKVIDQSIDAFNDASIFTSFSEKVIHSQGALIGYFMNESLNILTEEEKDLMWYCSLIILKSWEESYGEISPLKKEILSSCEEDNYVILTDKQLRFYEIANLYFKDYPQEDLLAFAEDTLIPDEEDFPSSVARKIIFISLKSLIDSLELSRTKI